jgi:poly(3-hydroxybutyrate) depolymerase
VGGGGFGGSGGGSGEGSGGAGTVKKSSGCGKRRTLQNGIVNLGQRKYALRVPDDYDKDQAYRLILGFHGATGNSGQVAPEFFGPWPLSAGTTIFVAPDAVNGLWSSATDVALVDDILAQVEAELCIDTARVQLEGFSQRGAMSWALACARPDVFRAVVVHSGGGVARPASCEPVAFMSSLGQKESGGAGQTSNSDFFAMQNGCTVQALPKAPSGGHLCSDYQGCLDGSPTRWCDYDGGHTPSPSDAGRDASWMPGEVWAFLKQF